MRQAKSINNVRFVINNEQRATKDDEKCVELNQFNYFIHLTLVPTIEDWAENLPPLAAKGLESKTIPAGDWIGTDHIDSPSKTSHQNSSPDIEKYTTIKCVSISLHCRRRTRGLT